MRFFLLFEQFVFEIMWKERQIYLADGGLETSLIFIYKLKLDLFASFLALGDGTGMEALRHYYKSYVAIAQRFKFGMILETATWRASPDWFEKLGFSLDQGSAIIHESVRLVKEIRDESITPQFSQILIAGVVGPRGDGYKSDMDKFTFQDYQSYHTFTINELVKAKVDYIAAVTMTSVAEAIGIVLACRKSEIPCVVSFTLEVDGQLPSGESLSNAIAAVDSACQSYPMHFMINCAHPNHFFHLWKQPCEEYQRIRGIRCNASKKSHQELDECEELDSGDIEDLSRLYTEFGQNGMPLSSDQYRIIGGCCGTDARHIEHIAQSFFNHQNL